MLNDWSGSSLANVAEVNSSEGCSGMGVCTVGSIFGEKFCNEYLSVGDYSGSSCSCCNRASSSCTSITAISQSFHRQAYVGYQTVGFLAGYHLFEIYLMPLDTSGKTTVLATSNYKYLYFCFQQMFVSQTSNGCNISCGDLIGSGTISGPVCLSNHAC